MNALARQRVEVGGERGHKGLAFTGLHFGDAPLMQHDAAEDLHRVMLELEHAPRRLAAGGERLGQNVVEGLAVGQTLFEFGRFGLQLAVAEFGIFFFQRQHLIFEGRDALDLFFGIISEKLFEK